MSTEALAIWMQPFAERVGFELEAGGADPPGVRVWRAPYALLGLWPVSGDTADGLLAAQNAGEAWIERRLLAEEKRGSVMDGYLVLVLTSAAKPDLRKVAGFVELDARFCRKHVVWPEPGEKSWSRVLRVTALGVPAVEVATGPAPPPELTEEQMRLVELVGAETSVQRAADAVRIDAGFNKEP